MARILHGLGAFVTVYDPAAMASARAAFPDLRYAVSPLEAARGAAVVLLLTEWPEFTALDPAGLLAAAAPGAAIIDGRHALDQDGWQAAGWAYRAPGVTAPGVSAQGDLTVASP